MLALAVSLPPPAKADQDKSKPVEVWAATVVVRSSTPSKKTSPTHRIFLIMLCLLLQGHENIDEILPLVKRFQCLAKNRAGYGCRDSVDGYMGRFHRITLCFGAAQ